MRLPPGSAPDTTEGLQHTPDPQLGNVGSRPCRGPRRIAGPRAPKPHDPQLHMHEPWHVATVLGKRKSISAYLKFQVGLFQAATIGLTQEFSVTVMIISGIPSPVELFLE